MAEARMRAMRLHTAHALLRAEQLVVPTPGQGEVLVKVHACGVCRTDLHIVDGELAGGTLPVTPGHEIVGTVSAAGRGAKRFRMGERVGIPWLGRTCGTCRYCRAGQENLCERARFTGFDADGGYAEYAVADERFCLPIPPRYGDAEVAPLMCAGLIGYRCLSMAGEARRLGLYGFGAAAHIVAQVARAEGREVYAFTRPGDATGQTFARRLGAVWVGDSTQAPPELIDAAILFAPVGALVPLALKAVRKGGVVVCGGIHMTDIPAFPYALLWGERRIQSVANLTRADGEAFMAIAARMPIHTEVNNFPLAAANDALDALRGGTFTGAAVLLP